MIGADDTRSASRTHASEECETSTIMPSAFARRTTASPKALMPAVVAVSPSSFSNPELVQMSL